MDPVYGLLVPSSTPPTSQVATAWRAYQRGGFEHLIRKAILHYLAPKEWLGLVRLKEGDTVIDLGGNVGRFARLAAERVGPTGRVITVEPHPENLAVLRNTCRGLENVVVVEGAVVDSEGSDRLKINPDNYGGHRMLRGNEAIDQGSEPETITVDTYTLDGLCDEYGIEQLGFLKIDIEGGEVGALRGGSRTLQSTDRVMVEAYHGNPDPENEDRTCGPEVYKILHNHRFNAAVTEDYMVFGWRSKSDRAPLLRRMIFTAFAGNYGIDRI